MNSDLESSLRLPPRKLVMPRDENDYYGASYLLAEHIGLRSERPPVSSGNWLHGPTPPWQPLLHPVELDYTIGNYLPRKLRRLLVPDKRSAVFLKQEGYPLAEAVGAPALLARSWALDKIRGSRLIVPSHTLAEDSGTYTLESVRSQVKHQLEKRNGYSLEVYCLHPAEIAKGVWPAVLDEFSCRWVTGASPDDMNALKRIVRLFSQFEHMSTNGFGSHVIYGLWLGANVTVDPKPAPYTKSYYESLDWLSRHSRREQLFQTSPNVSISAAWFWRKSLGLTGEIPTPEETKVLADKSMGVDVELDPARIADLLGWRRGSASWFLGLTRAPDRALRNFKRRLLNGG